MSLDPRWIGGAYELSVAFEAPDGLGVGPFFADFLTAAGMLGRHSDQHVDSWRRDDEAPLGSDESVYGRVRTPDGKLLLCGAFAVEEQHGFSLVLYVPLAELRASDSRVGRYPGSEEDSLSWRTDKDLWLSGIAATFYKKHRFSLGLVGFQVSGQYSASDRVPDDRPCGFLVPASEGLTYHPATH